MQKRKRGNSLLIVIVVASLLLWMAAIATSNLTLSKNHTLQASQLEQCRYAAHAGLQQGLLELVSGGPYAQQVFANTNPAAPPVKMDGRLATDPRLHYKVEFLHNQTNNMVPAPDGSDIPPGAVYIYSRGYIEGTTVMASASGFSALALRTKPVFDYAALSNAEIQVLGDSIIDAWDSAVSAYPGPNPFNPLDPNTYTKSATLASNLGTTAIKLQGATAVDGDLLVGPDALNPSACVQMAGTVTVSGTTDNQSGARRIPLWETTLNVAAATTPVSVPAGTSHTLAPGPYLQLSAGQTGQARTTLILQPGEYYFDKDVNLDNVDVQVAPGTDPVVIYVKGNVNVKGQSAVNQDAPARLQMYFTGKDKDFLIEDNSAMTMVAAGSETSVNLKNGSQVFGAVMAHDITLEGTGSKLHYDKALKGVPLAGNGKWQLQGIREQNGSKVIGGQAGGGGNGNGNGGNSGSGSSGSGSGSGSSGSGTSGSGTTGGTTTGGTTTGGTTTGGTTTGGNGNGNGGGNKNKGHRKGKHHGH